MPSYRLDSALITLFSRFTNISSDCHHQRVAIRFRFAHRLPLNCLPIYSKASTAKQKEPNRYQLIYYQDTAQNYNMKVSEYMTAASNAQTASPGTSLVDIAKQLTKHNCSCIVIVEEEKPVGMYF